MVYKTKGKKILSLLMALVLVMGLLPTTVIPAMADTSNFPETISCSDYIMQKYKNGELKRYTSVNGLGTPKFNYFEMFVNGRPETGFCVKHNLSFGAHSIDKQWKLSRVIPAGTEPEWQVFADDYYFGLWASEEVDEMYPTLTVDEKYPMLKWPADMNNPYDVSTNNSYYTAEGNRAWANAVNQAVMWLGLDPNYHIDLPHMMEIDTPEAIEDIKKITAERVQAINGFYGFDSGSTVDGSYWMIQAAIWRWLNGYIPKLDYAIYDPVGDHGGYHDQSILVPYRETGDPGVNKAWVKVYKVDENLSPLAGATFSVYQDQQGTRWLENMTTNSDGWAYAEISLGTKTSMDVWVKETSAASGYGTVPGTWKVTLSSANNDTKEKAAAVLGGAGIQNITNDIPYDCVIKKIDAVTGKGVGKATIRFVGQADEDFGGNMVDTQFQTDIAGNLPIQWKNPNADFYIAPGQYTVTEEVPPDGYAKTDEEYHLVLKYSPADSIYWHSGNIVFKNNPLRSIILRKVDGSGNPLEGAVFEIYRDGQFLETRETGPDGTIVYDGKDGKGLEDGYYEFKEITPPDGYFLPARTVQGVLIDSSVQHDVSPVTITFTNWDWAEIKIQKFETGTTTPLEGATFEVMIDGGNAFEVGPTGKDGTIVLNYATYGKFLPLTDSDGNPKNSWTISVREKVAPDGYLLDEDSTQWHTLELHKGEDLKPFVFEDTKYPEIVIYKLDSETQKPLPGCSFRVTIDGNEIAGPLVTGPDGKVVINYEQYAEFLNGHDWDGWQVTVTELEMPEGYNKDFQEDSGDYTITKTMNYGQSELPFTFKDTRFRSIKVIKRDDSNSWTLPGAVFKLESIELDPPKQNDHISREDKTNDNGEILWTEIPNGTYRVTEITPPTGYNLPNPASQIIEVTSGSDNVIVMEFEDAPKQGLLVRKIDAVTQKPIEGVKFTIQYLGTADNEHGITNDPKEYITNESGLIVLEDCQPGWYEITETNTPDGYVLDPTPKRIQVVNAHDAVTVTFENYQDTQLIVLKKDTQTGLPLPGALFEITTAGGNYIATIETGPTGYAQLSGLEPGGYVITEVQAPDGHIIDPTPQTFEIKKGQTEPIFKIFYNSNKINLFIRKEDAQTHVPLEGAVYRVTLSSGEVVRERLVTGEDGLASLTGLNPGTYVVEEIEAPKGYLLNDPPANKQTVYLQPGHTETMLFRNEKPGGIAILKTDALTGAPIKGAEFALSTMDDRLIKTYETGEDGYIRISDLEPGYYFVQETKAPEGYLLDSTKHKVLVEDFKVTLVKLLNYQQSGLTVYKIAKDSKIPLYGAEFGVYDMHGSLLKTITTNTSGVASLNGLQPGWYRVKETKPPVGYLLNEEEQQVEIIEGRPSTLTFEDVEESGITVNKVDAVSKDPLIGAQFELRTVENELLGTYTTNASGSFVTKKVDPGVYYLWETKAPAGYTANVDATKVTVKEGENPVVTIENHKNTTIEMMKVDAVTGAYLEGAEFEVWTLNCAKLLGTYVTDKSGIAYSDPLPAGNYIVIESKAPTGYALDSTHHHVQLLYDHPAILKVADQPLTAIQITKVSTVDDEPLLGAKFEVKTAEGKVVGEYTTDTTGTTVTPVLEPGVYYVQEVEAPDGYLLNPKIFKVELEAGKMGTLVVEDSPECSLVIFKGDSSSKKGIAGAVFKVETADGDFIGTYTTDSQGEALIRPITPGHYIVTEMSAPEGYQVSDEPKTITVKPGVVNRVEFMDAAKGSLVIRLEDQSDGHKLENGRFQLFWAATGKLVAEGVTDNSGSIVWGSLAPGRYEIVHTYAPDGYTIVDERKEGIVISGETTIVVFKDCTAGIVIEKLDRLTEKPLAGARFQVTRNSDNIVIGEYVTDKDGLALVSGLIPGMYTVEELSAPTGYAIDEASQLTHVKAGEQAHVTFRDTPFAGITVNTVDKDTRAPLAGIVIEVWRQNGELVNTYTSDSTGVIQTDKLAAGYYVLKVIKVINNYTAVQTEQTVEIKDGVAVTVTFEFTAGGVLQIHALSTDEKGLPGMKVTVAKITGEFVGNYTADASGLIKVPNLTAGWYVVTEVTAPDGYTITGDTAQNVEVTSNGDATLKFYHAKSYGVQIRTIVKQTGVMLAGVKYQITKLDGSIVGNYTSDATGLAYVTLEPGFYVIKQTSLPAGYESFTLCSSRTVEVKAGAPTVVEFELAQMSSIRVKFVDGTTEQPIYGVRVMLKDGTGKIVDEYTSNNEGYITIKQTVLNGTYTLEQISVPSGYTVDPVPKSLEVLNGETTEIVWRMYTGAGQIQVHLTSNAYNPTVDLAAGSNLAGAVFEIYDPFTYAVLCTMTTDSYGVAASSGLPIGRYIVREKSPAPYYGMSGKETEVYIKINNDVVRVEYQAGVLNLKTTNTIKSNANVSAGTSMKVIFTAVNNDSSDRLDNFFWTIKVPTDAMRAGTLYTGKWSHSVFYSISYKTNMNDYRQLATGLNSSNAYQYDLSSLSINVQGGEYVTDIRFEFGTVPGGFKPTVSPIFYGYIMPNVPNGYKAIVRSECGGKYGESWNTASALWTTAVVNTGKSSGAYAPGGFYPSTLPKTGY